MKNGYENFIKCFTWAVRETEDPNALYIPYTLGSMIFHILFIQFSLFFIPPISGLPPFDLLPIHRHTPPSSSHFNNSTKASYKLLAEEQYDRLSFSTSYICTVCPPANANRSFL